MKSYSRIKIFWRDGFLNIDINGKTLKGTFYADEIKQPNSSSNVNDKNNAIDTLQYQRHNYLLRAQ
jgi:hypothetical protein